jgi:hypothetical protein
MSDSLTARLEALWRAELTTLRDKEAIRDVIHRYCRGADRCDLQAFKDCYWADGYDDHGFFGGNGQEFGDYVIPILKQAEASIHAITNTIIDLKGDRAFCESQWSVIHRLKKPDGDFARLLASGPLPRHLRKARAANGASCAAPSSGDMDRLVRTKDMRSVMGTGVAWQ